MVSVVGDECSKVAGFPLVSGAGGGYKTQGFFGFGDPDVSCYVRLYYVYTVSLLRIYFWKEGN